MSEIETKMKHLNLQLLFICTCVSFAFSQFPQCTIDDWNDYEINCTPICDCKSFCLGEFLTDGHTNNHKQCGSWCSEYPGCNWYVWNTVSFTCTLTQYCDEHWGPYCPDCIIGNKYCHSKS